MTVIIPGPDELPYGVLHPASHYRHLFREHGELWHSVAQFCLAQTLANPADRARVRVEARDPAHALELARAMPREPSAQGRMFEILCHAYRSLIEQNLDLRALLLRTGNSALHVADTSALTLTGFEQDTCEHEPIARALLHVRSLVGARAADPGAVQCHHPDAVDTRTLCVHRLDAPSRALHIRRHFTGRGRDYQLLCEDCCQALPAEPPLRRMCQHCFGRLLRESRNHPDLGMPEILERRTALRFQHRDQPCLEQPSWIATVPIPGAPHSWLCLTRDGVLQQLDSQTARVRTLATLDGGLLDLESSVVLGAAPRAGLVFVAEAHGCKALVLEPRTGRITLRLEREAYREEHCRFPIGFFVLDERLLLVHATGWNRLDVSDPRTGELLTQREQSDEQDERAHGLEYFHASLTISPDGAWAAESGWIWQPVGLVRSFSLTRWLRDNVWESEDGPSVRELPGTEFVWDVGVAWLNARTVAVWGDGEDFETLVPAVSIYDVETGERLRRFDGPGMALAALPPYLLSYEAGRGISLWDPTTGERLHHDTSFVPVAVHPDSRELVSFPAAGQIRVSRLALE